MRSRFAFALVGLVTFLSTTTLGQSGLSNNSGINSSDTWVTLDITVSDSANVNFSQAIYNPQTQSSTATMPVAPAPETFHMEAGYDANGGVVLNLWPKGSAGSLYSTDTSNLGVIRFADGKVTVVDQNGNILPNIALDSRISANFPLSFLGSNPGPSVIASLVVPNIQQYSSALNASLTINAQSALVQSSFSQNGSAAWTYVQSGTNWVAQQVAISYSNSQLSDTRTIQFANMNWSDNASKDDARAAAGSTVQSPPAGGPFPSTFTWTAPASPALSNNSCTTINPSDCNTHTYNCGGSQNIVFQHGLNSSSCAWTRMANWINGDYSFGNEVIPSLDATAGIATQGQALINEVNAVGGGNYILMGHSMGGLVSRYAAQYFQANNPSALFGVASVDTPHQGANSAFNLPAFGTVILTAKAIQLWIDDGCYSQWDSWGCFLAYAMGGAGGYIASVYANSPALQDLTPGSQALNSLNANTESFTRAGVIGYTPQRWLFTRVAWNWFLGSPISGCQPTDPACCPPESGCGEEAVATQVEIFHDVILAEAFLVLFEIETYCDYNYYNDGCQVPPSLWALFDQLLSIDIDLDIIDAVFDVLVDFPGDGTSDGLVQGPSQIYPGSGAVQYHINDADSHSGALKSPKDHPYLDAVLANSFNMKPSVSCAFSVSTSLSSPDTFAASGGSDSFQVTAGSNCPWSAVGQEPWINISSGVSGVGNESVSFSVAPDNTSASRLGTIVVGNGNNSATFYVSQTGSCSYALSQGPVETIPPSGASAPVTVSTQQDCIWSASSNAAWLTLTNSSGTGVGSFTWTAAANTGSTGRTGMITVANQTLVLVDGNPVGTPGTATVNIQGSPQSISFNPCAPYQWCPQTVNEGGSVSITIDGVTFTSGYGGSTNASQIASGLAALMNYQYSPVTATVSGATITINAAVNGADTDYPLTVSDTFGPQCGSYPCFSTPAFVAVPSGSQLTGGSD